MAGLSNIFGGDDSNSNSDGGASTDSVGNATNAIGLDYSDNNSQSSTHNDGSSDSSSSSHDLGFDSNTDSLLSSATDTVGMTD